MKSNDNTLHLKHAVCRWCYDHVSLENFCENLQQFGVKGIDLLVPEEWGVLRKYGLECSLATDTFLTIEEGFNNPDNHPFLISNYKRLIKQAADAGVRHVIVFSGNRNGISDQEGLENCAWGLKELVRFAEETGVVLVMELLNSKVDHVDYQCDNTNWGTALVDKLGSPNFKLLYDIYHMQIMEGNVIATIRKNHNYFAHYHTGGVPGRHELNETQELNYKAIMQAISATGFSGFVAQEFIPSYENSWHALQESIEVCSV